MRTTLTSAGSALARWRSRSHENAGLVVASMLACASAAAAFGADANFDLRNYHLYVAWAWLADRGMLDIAAAQAQTWFNPLLSIPHFLAFERLHGVGLAVTIGALQGLCAAPLLSLATNLLPQSTLAIRALLAAAGLMSASFIGQLGASYGDSLLALAVLSAIALLAGSTSTRSSAAREIAAGLLLGGVVALKLALAPLALGLCIALPLLVTDGQARVRLLARVGLAAATAFALLAGPWMWSMWQAWGNPVFPHLDALFPGEWIAPGAGRDVRFLPATLGDALLRPFAPLLDWRASTDYRIRDGRIALMFAAVAMLIWRWRQIDTERRPVLRWLAMAFVLGYAIWLPLFGYHRYLLPWEMLAPLLLVAATASGTAYRLALALVVLTMLTTNPPNHERAGRDWRAGQPLGSPAVVLAPDTLIVMTGVEPTSHVLPFLPPFAAAVRIESNLHGRLRPRAALDALANSRIATHAGSFVLLLQATDPTTANAAISGVGLQRTDTPCVALDDALIPGGEPPIQLCELRKLGTDRAGLR